MDETTGTTSIELEQEFIVIAIPATTVKLSIEAEVYDNGKVIQVGRDMDFGEVRAAISEARACYIPSDTVFTLTDVGREYLEKLKEKYGYGEDEETE